MSLRQSLAKAQEEPPKEQPSRSEEEEEKGIALTFSLKATLSFLPV
jgi:hypothetical protein